MGGGGVIQIANVQRSNFMHVKLLTLLKSR